MNKFKINSEKFEKKQILIFLMSVLASQTKTTLTKDTATNSKINNEFHSQPHGILHNILVVLEKYYRQNPSTSCSHMYAAVDAQTKKTYSLSSDISLVIDKLMLMRIRSQSYTFNRDVWTVYLHPSEIVDGMPRICMRKDESYMYITKNINISNSVATGRGIHLDCRAAEICLEYNYSRAVSYWPNNVILTRLCRHFYRHKNDSEATLVCNPIQLRKLCEIISQDEAGQLECIVTLVGDIQVTAYLILKKREDDSQIFKMMIGLFAR